MTPFQSKPRPCRQCQTLFTPMRSTAVVCSPSCAIKSVKAQKAATKVALKARKAAIKTHSQWHAEAQKAVNAYVRLRDQGQPCISCGKPWQADNQAGHYRSRGAAKHLALDPRNIFGQCIQCNLHKHSNAVEYRIRLAQRCGMAHVEAIEADNEPRHYSIADLQAIRADFLLAAKNLKANS